MDTATFKEQVQSMPGLTPEMKDHLMSIADDLSDTQRADAVKELEQASNEVVGAIEDMKAINQDVDEKTSEMRGEIQELRNEAESVEHAADLKSVESNLDQSQ